LIRRCISPDINIFLSTDDIVNKDKDRIKRDPLISEEINLLINSVNKDEDTIKRDPLIAGEIYLLINR
jgi:hypothetical protein